MPIGIVWLVMSLLKPENPEALPRDNPFRTMSKMARESLGKLPAHLVIIFCVALTIAVVIGVSMQFAGTRPMSGETYLQSRLKPQGDKQAVTEEQLRGVWMYKSGERIATLRIGNGIFEIISYLNNRNVSRSFLRGGYRIEGNMIVMQERKDLGTPIDHNHYEYKFYPLAVETISLYAETDGRVMTWRTPASEARRLENPEEVTQIIFGAQMPWVKVALKP